MSTTLYVAKENLLVGRACAYNAGDTLTAEAVEAGGWQDQVAKVGTKAAEAVAPDLEVDGS